MGAGRGGHQYVDSTGGNDYGALRRSVNRGTIPVQSAASGNFNVNNAPQSALSMAGGGGSFGGDTLVVMERKGMVGYAPASTLHIQREVLPPSPHPPPAHPRWQTKPTSNSNDYERRNTHIKSGKQLSSPAVKPTKLDGPDRLIQMHGTNNTTVDTRANDSLLMRSKASTSSTMATRGSTLIPRPLSETRSPTNRATNVPTKPISLSSSTFRPAPEPASSAYTLRRQLLSRPSADLDELGPISSDIHKMATRVHLQKSGSDVWQLANGRTRVVSKPLPTSNHDEQATEQLLPDSQKGDEGLLDSGSASDNIKKPEQPCPPFRSSQNRRPDSHHPPGRWELLTTTAPKNDYKYVPPAAAKYFLWDNTPIAPTLCHMSIPKLKTPSIRLQSGAWRAMRSYSAKTLSAATGLQKKDLDVVGLFIGRWVDTSLDDVERRELEKEVLGRAEKVILLDRFDPGKRVSGVGGQEGVDPSVVLKGDLVVKVARSRTPGISFESEEYEVLMKSFDTDTSVWETFPTFVKFDVSDESNKIPPKIEVLQLLPSLYIRAQPIHPLRLVPTSLSFELLKDSSPSDKREVETGYVTIDQTRHVMPLHRNDRMVEQLPLVGIWVRNAESPKDPQVQTLCARYVMNCRVSKLETGKERFLLLLIKSVEGENGRVTTVPEFWECGFDMGKERFKAFKGSSSVYTDANEVGGSMELAGLCDMEEVEEPEEGFVEALERFYGMSFARKFQPGAASTRKPFFAVDACFTVHVANGSSIFSVDWESAEIVASVDVETQRPTEPESAAQKVELPSPEPATLDKPFFTTKPTPPSLFGVSEPQTTTDLESAVQKFGLPSTLGDAHTLPPDTGSNYKPFFEYEAIKEDLVDQLLSVPEKADVVEAANRSSGTVKSGDEGEGIEMGSIELSRICKPGQLEEDDECGLENQTFGTQETGLPQKTTESEGDEDTEERTRDMIAQLVEDPEKSFIFLDQTSSLSKPPSKKMESPLVVISKKHTTTATQHHPDRFRIAATEGRSLLRDLMLPAAPPTPTTNHTQIPTTVQRNLSPAPYGGLVGKGVPSTPVYDISRTTAEPYSKATLEYLVKYGLVGEDNNETIADVSFDVDSPNDSISIDKLKKRLQF
ncbi:hypothetical protein HDV05_000176 [Chytridiales sp. JEL 0842]|nr:hypothetical protein HDV05_000176 [Chytridiales sp. JEL 0842]